MTQTEIEIIHKFFAESVPEECELISVRTYEGGILHNGKNNPSFLTEVLVKNKKTDKQLLSKFNSKKILRQITKEAKYGKFAGQIAGFK